MFALNRRHALAALTSLMALTAPSAIGTGRAFALPPASNDRPSNAVDLGSVAAADLAGQDNQHATAETTTLFGCVATANTVWYRWTAPATGIVQFRATNDRSDLADLTIAAFRGDPTSLTSRASRVACNDDARGIDHDSLDPNINFQAEAGQLYYVAVGAYDAYNAGPFALRMRFVSVTLAGAQVVEGDDGTVVAPISIRLSSDALNPLLVRVEDSGTGTATAGADYVALYGEVTLQPGQTSVTGNLMIQGDRVAEADETVVLKSPRAIVAGSTPANPSVGATEFNPRASSQVKILDNDLGWIE